MGEAPGLVEEVPGLAEEAPGLAEEAPTGQRQVDSLEACFGLEPE